MNNSSLYFKIINRIISYWDRYNHDRDWYREYMSVSPMLYNYPTYKAIRYIESTMRSKYRLGLKKNIIKYSR